MFKGFERKLVDVGEVSINCVTGGQGSAVLLLHGYPQSLVEWAKVAPSLAREFTVVCVDLRGYGDSSKPRGQADFSNYSFRAMAADQVRLMAALGFERFHVVGHDRGARVAHRMALDWTDRVLSLAVLDIVPTYDMYNNVTRTLAATFWSWYFLPLAEPLPERMIGADPDFFYESLMARVGGNGPQFFEPEMMDEYRRCWRDPDAIHAWCCDYRAGASIDLQHDEADLGRKIGCPTLALWGADGKMCKIFDIEAHWRERCSHLSTASVPGGHWFPEQSAAETAAILAAHLRGELPPVS
ncbi:alpha/beta hydrolase [Aquamicrobium sp. LC103]|uniref:alpha/beta fold hydrolase n=1 Tax=Aquamicrobium sp. LC103 TaxID=1120658 RepID=UPI00063E89EF|nr:alpha/beta hydrolase [Aquamicrobium sp. LC103]TKT74481.1 alpha/beta hydrolase [Aquamicrobium sp. LC103]